MAMKSRKQYANGPTLGPKSHYPAISQAYWAPQPQTVPYSVPGISVEFKKANKSENRTETISKTPPSPSPSPSPSPAVVVAATPASVDLPYQLDEYETRTDVNLIFLNISEKFQQFPDLDLFSHH
ncbi:hypothetical protein M0804_009467 [Polistes exclamans]|nr:hypothetical protein M0804_009467 [Polistes exclamans]